MSVLKRRRKSRICWPSFDKICLEGGCVHCMQDTSDTKIQWHNDIAARAVELDIVPSISSAYSCMEVNRLYG